MPPANPDEGAIHACKTCRRVLYRILADGKVIAYAHVEELPEARRTGALQLDHEAIPVPALDTDVINLCDFCRTPGAVWYLPAEDFEWDVAPGHWSRFGWAACEACNADIEGGRWSAMVRRSAIPFEQENNGGRVHAGYRSSTFKVFMQFRDARYGAPIRLDSR